MKFPRYAVAYKTGAPSPLESYISFMADNGSGRTMQWDQLDPPRRPSHADLYIGQACLELANGKDKTARRMLRGVQANMKPIVKDPAQRSSRMGRQAIQALTTARLLDQRENKGAVGTVRREMHNEVVGNVQQLRDILTDETVEMKAGLRGTFNGELVEQTALGVLTRYAHPRILAMPALDFQDKAPQRRSSFDLVLVESFSGQTANDESIIQKVQAKSFCMEFCEKTAQSKDYRDEYNADIALLSGCCDLEMRGSGRNPARYAVPTMLIREVAGQATPEDIAALDEVTNRALFNLTIGDERRMGQLPVDSLMATA